MQKNFKENRNSKIMPKNREKTTKQSNENRPNIKENIENFIFYKVRLYKQVQEEKGS